MSRFDAQDLQYPALEDLVHISEEGEPLSPFLMLYLYSQGVFPFLRHRGRTWWWSPSPRAVFLTSHFHVSRSLAKTLRQGRLTTTADIAFEEVVRGCRTAHLSSWITEEMEQTFLSLHALGHAHSVETWCGTELVGGLFGIAVGRIFFGLSMYHIERDASKVALVRLAQQLEAMRFPLIDCQLQNPHLKRMGSQLISRKQYSEAVARLVRKPGIVGSWAPYF